MIEVEHRKPGLRPERRAGTSSMDSHKEGLSIMLSSAPSVSGLDGEAWIQPHLISQDNANCSDDRSTLFPSWRQSIASRAIPTRLITLNLLSSSLLRQSPTGRLVTTAHCSPRPIDTSLRLSPSRLILPARASASRLLLPHPVGSTRLDPSRPVSTRLDPSRPSRTPLGIPTNLAPSLRLDYPLSRRTDTTIRLMSVQHLPNRLLIPIPPRTDTTTQL